MNKIYITGVSGTGKTTIAKELKRRGYYAISIDETDNLCSWVNKKTKEKVEGEVKLNTNFTSKHDWICDVEHLDKLLNVNRDTVFVLGVASNQDDFLDVFNKIFILQCNPKTFYKRIDERTDNEFGKDETVKQSILGYYQDFENKMLEKEAISVNVEKSVNEVVDEILKKANS